MFYCPRCGNEIIKDYPDGKTKLRTNILIFEQDKEKAVCKCNVCHADVEIPISLNLKKEL